MQNNRQAIINFGLIQGLVSVTLAVVLYATGNYNMSGQGDANILYSVLNLAVSVVFPLLAILKVREIGGGFISFGKAFSTGFQVILIAAILGAVWLLVYTTTLEPNYQEVILQNNYEQMSEQGMSSEQIDQAIEMTKRFTTPTFMAVFAVLTSAFFGAIIALILGGILQRKDPNSIV